MTSQQGPLGRRRLFDAWLHSGRVRHGLRVVWFAFAWLSVALFFASGALVLVVRYAVMPRVDELRPRIEQIASRALRAPVTISRIEASWRGFHPHLVLSDLQVAGREDHRGLSLPRVEGTVSWLSVVAFEPRFTLLRIEAPDLEVVRLPGDRFAVAGFLIERDSKEEDSGVSDWILAQGKLVVSNARIRYRDTRGAATSVDFEFTRVNMKLERRLGAHFFGLQAQPTASIAGPIDVRARFRHSPFARLSDHTRWTGEIYGSVNYFDLASLARLFGAPVKIERAEGAVRSWLSFDRARISRVTADVALVNVNATLGDDLKPLTLASLQGRVSQRRWGDDNGNGGQEFSAQGLTLVNGAQQTVPPLDLEVRTTRASAGHDARTQVKASRVDLQNLTWLAAHVPLAPALRETISSHVVTGTLSQVSASWEGSKPSVTNLAVKSQFAHLASAARPALADEIGVPGFENLTGSIEVANGGGTLKLASKDAVLTAPGVFAESRIRLSSLATTLHWKSDPALEVRVDSLAAGNSDIDFEASGTYRAAAAPTAAEKRAPGSLDVTGRFMRLDAPAAYRYMPTIAGTTTIDWLQHALVAGKVTDGSFRVKGDLAQFPFSGERRGEMRITARVTDGTLDVHPTDIRAKADTARTWPLLTGIDADLLIDRASMTVSAQRGAALGVRLGAVVARIAELGRDATLDVRGVADGPLADMLRYVNASPVARWIGGVTAGAEASGNAKLDLRLIIPLRHAVDSKVVGALQFASNDLQLTDAPAFSRVSGTLNFTEAGINANGLNATLLGGQARIDAATRSDGSIAFAAAGSATVPGLRRTLPWGAVQQLLDRSQGQARYTATLMVKPTVELRVDSDLVGIAIDGIAPLRKTAQEAMPLRVERSATGGDRDELRVNAGRAFAVRLERHGERGDMRVTRGVIALNEPANLPESGLLVLATVPRLDLQAWSLFLGGTEGDAAVAKPASKPASDTQIDLLAVRTPELVVLGRTFRNVTLGASRTSSGGFDANIVSDGVAGYVAWRPEQITARLSRLVIPAAVKSEVIEALRSPPRELPALDIAAEHFELADLKLGRLDLVAHNVGAVATSAWHVKRFDVTNPDMKLTASGEWAPAAGTAARRVKMNFKIDARDAGATLDRLGFAGAMASGSGALEGDVEWLGSPLDIDYATLMGTLALSLDNGRFLKVDTGKAARLLSLLSLQSLSRTLLFDSGRPFSEGFAFSSIRADATVAQGVISTNNFRMAGATAAALMSGTIDLRNETQQLHLVVLPEIDASTAALALGVANPVLGLGAFLASYVLRNPLSKAFSFEYDISGTWASPTVTRRSRSAANGAPSAEVIR
ncbi:MAG: YhdP family protein [Burkholderiaceae bacterium]